jgi:hypothetical protein
VTTAAATTTAALPVERDRVRFFSLLIAVTVLPYVLFPLATHVVPDEPNVQALMLVLLFLGSAGHVAASFFFYGDEQVRGFMFDGQRARYLVVPTLVALLMTLLLFIDRDPVRSWVLVGFWTWQVHHFTRQNHGILAFASRADDVAVDPKERLAITLTDVAAILATIAFVTPYRNTFLDIYGWHLHAIGLGVFACAWVVYLATRPLRRFRSTPWRESLVVALMAFYAPLFLFDDAFSAVYIYLTAHGLQYLIFMYFVVRVPVSTRRRAAMQLVLFTALGGGLIMLLKRQQLWGGWAPTLLGLAYGITIWHFLLDAGLWRLSEPFQRSYMAQRFGFLRSRGRPGAEARAV